MSTLTVFLLINLSSAAWAALECYDWQGKTVPDGIEFYPKAEDPCYMCRCDKGSSTMCKTVSCAPPNCLNWQKLSGCCQFECLGDGPGSPGDNYTGAPPGTGVSDAPTDHTMTDLGLRLVASTVTTFLILALLLFLIHRVRQRRLLVSLRRYSRRRERFDDEDNVSYSPEYFGIQCPPYEDPPPPYSPPKPHIHHRELPPPYETINRSGNFQNFDGNSHNPERDPSSATSFDCDTQSVVINSNRVLHAGNTSGEGDPSGVGQGGNDNQTRTCSVADAAPAVSVRYSGGNTCTTRPSVPSTISTNIHHRNSLNGNQAGVNNNSFSSVQHVVTPKDLPSPIVLGTAVLCMTHVSQTPEFHVSDCRSDSRANEADIESSDSSGDCSPDSLELESEHMQKKGNFSPKRQSNSMKVNATAHPDSPGNPEVLSEDAETTVKQFLERQFGPLSKVRHYPTTMSQSWTSTMFMSTMPNMADSALPNLRESCSVGSFSTNDSPDQKSESVARNKDRSACRVDNQKLPYSQVADNSRISDQTRTLPTSQAARVSYLDADEFSSSKVPGTQPDNINNNVVSSQCSNHASEETDTNCSFTAQSLDSPAVSEIGDSHRESQRQDVLRELRLSHLLYSPPSSFENTASPTSPPRLSQTFQMQRSQSINSENSVCSETGEKRLVGRLPSVAISNDAAYPESSYRNFLRSSLLPQSSNEETNANLPNADIASSQDRELYDGEQNVEKIVSKKSISEDQPLTKEEDKVNRNYFSDNWSNINPTENVQTCGSSADGFGNIADENRGQGQSSINGTLTHSPQKLSYNFEPNYNWNIHNKLINDKDVSSFCSPESGSTRQGEGHGRPGNISPPRAVPSSSMRACASQLYNCETESHVPKKDKRPINIHNRHSAGCFPVHKSSTDSKSSPLEPKISKVKGNPPRKRSPKVVNDIGSNGISESIFAVPKGRTCKTNSGNDRKDYGFVDTPAHLRTSLDGEESVSARYSLHSEPATPVSVTEPPLRNGPQKAQNIAKSHKGEHRRARSLGKSEHVVPSVEKSNKTLDNHSSRKSHNRRKKNCQSFPGSSAFHQELEHVLESQKQTMRTSLAKAMAGNGKKPSQNAVTQV